MNRFSYKLFLDLLRSQAKYFVLLVLVASIYSTSQVLLPYFVKSMINAAQWLQDQAAQKAFIQAIIFLVSFWMLSNLMVYVQGKILVYLLPAFRTLISLRSIHAIQQQSYQKISNVQTGSLSRKITDLTASSEKIAHFIFVNVTHFVISVSVFVVILLFTFPLCAGILALWLVLHGWNLKYYLTQGVHHARNLADSSSILSGKIGDLLSNIKIVHLFSSQAYEKEYLKGYLLSEEETSRCMISHLETMKMRQSFLTAAFILSSILIVGFKMYEGKITVGDFSMVVVLCFSISSVVFSMSFQFISVIREFGAFASGAKAIFSTDALKKKKNEVKKPSANILSGEITVKNVYFRYTQNGDYLFKDLNIHINQGERVNITGRSGSGKTTLLHLLLGLYKMEQGSIYIDQEEKGAYDPTVLQAAIAYVPQDALLFNRSIRENVCYGISATEDEFTQALNQANCMEFINKFPEGYHTLVGERGNQLSGGQRQRLAIARAILKQSPIIILDEPTASLDEVNCKLVEECILRLNQDRTVIIVSHRVSTLKYADRTLVLEAGELIADIKTTSFLANPSYLQLEAA